MMSANFAQGLTKDGAASYGGHTSVAGTHRRFHTTGGPLPNGMTQLSSLLGDFPASLPLMGDHDAPNGVYPEWNTGTEAPSVPAHQQFDAPFYISESVQDRFLSDSDRIPPGQSNSSPFTPVQHHPYTTGYGSVKQESSSVQLEVSPRQHRRGVSQSSQGHGISVRPRLDSLPDLFTGNPPDVAHVGSMNDAHTHHTTAGPDYRRISVLSDSSHRANQSRIHSGRSGLADISISTGVVPSPERQLPHHPAGLSLLSPQSPIAAVSGVIWNNGPQSGQSSPTAARPTSRRQSTTDRFASLDQLKSPRDRTRRPSLKTCNLDEAGLDFPGCFVLVPADAEDHDSLYPDNTHDLQEPKLLTTNKKIYRRPMGDNERAAIKLNRKNGVCLRCKVFKERCRGGLPCERCRSLKLWRTLCVPATFSDKTVFSRDLYKSRVRQLLENIRCWKAPPNAPEVIEVSNGFHPKIRLTIHEYESYDDSLNDHILWRVVGEPSFTRLGGSPFGIREDTNFPLASLDRYIDEHLYLLLSPGPHKSGPWSGIRHRTLETAYKYSDTNKEQGGLVRKALRIWVIQTLFFKYPWRIAGLNRVGMSEIRRAGTDIDGLVPVPRLVNQQLDSLLEARMALLEEELLAELQLRVPRRIASEWFGIYLAIYVYFASIERDSWSLKTWEIDSQSVKAKTSDMTLDSEAQGFIQRVWTWPLQEQPNSLVKKNGALTDILLAHFRSVTKGYIPFTLDWDSDQVTSMAAADHDAVEYMRSTVKWLREVGSDELIADRNAAQYFRDDDDSLNATLTSKLMSSDESIQQAHEL